MVKLICLLDMFLWINFLCSVSIKVDDSDGLFICDPVPNAGHSMYDEGILYELVRASDSFKNLKY